MNDLPEPFVGPDIDLKGFPGFVLDVEALLASELVALASPEEIAAALMLWCRAWQQVPHGSLPNDERILAAFSKAKNWKKVREMALRGFVLCSDGRLYHKVLCKHVQDAWKRRVEYQTKREKDAERLRGWREKKQAKNAGGNDEGNDSSNDEGNAHGNDDETRFKDSTKPLRSRSEVKGSEETTSDPNGSGGKPPKVTDPDEIIFGYGVPLLTNAGTKEKEARSFLGKLRKDHGDKAVVDKLRDCIREKPLQPLTWLAAALPPNDAAGKPNRQESLEAKNRQIAAELAGENP